MIRTAGDRRTALIDRLTAHGHLPDLAWRAAFAEVPREEFVPWFFAPNRDRPGWRLLEHDDEWLDGVYRDEALVTQLGGDETAAVRARAGEAVQGVPTSSSSAPSLMAAMLDALQVEPGHRVFEAATGTGYNAALLAHRLGSDLVTSLEIDPAVTERARAALHGLGHRPTLATGDATLGCPGSGPFDRIISTVAVPSLPPSWLTQTRSGARLVVPLVLAGHSGVIVALDRGEDGVRTAVSWLSTAGSWPPGQPRSPLPDPRRSGTRCSTTPDRRARAGARRPGIQLPSSSRCSPPRSAGWGSPPPTPRPARRPGAMGSTDRPSCTSTSRAGRGSRPRARCGRTSRMPTAAGCVSADRPGPGSGSPSPRPGSTCHGSTARPRPADSVPRLSAPQAARARAATGGPTVTTRCDPRSPGPPRPSATSGRLTCPSRRSGPSNRSSPVGRLGASCRSSPWSSRRRCPPASDGPGPV